MRRHRPQRDGLPSRRRVPVRGARHQPVGEGDDRILPAQPVRAAPAAQVQDQLLRLRHRLRPGHVQRRRRHRREPPQVRRHARARLQGVRGRRARRQPASRAGARGVHAARAAHADARGDRARVRPLRQPRQQAAGAHEVAGRHDGHGGAARAHLQGAQVPPRRELLPRRHSRRRAGARRRPRRRGQGPGHPGRRGGKGAGARPLGPARHGRQRLGVDTGRLRPIRRERPWRGEGPIEPVLLRRLRLSPSPPSRAR